MRPRRTSPGPADAAGSLKIRREKRRKANYMTPPMELLEATWESLVPHQGRGAVFACFDGLQVADAAQALADNSVAVVEAWLGSGHLRRPTPQEWTSWASRRFVAAIVQPWVVVALVEEDGNGSG